MSMCAHNCVNECVGGKRWSWFILTCMTNLPLKPKKLRNNSGVRSTLARLPICQRANTEGQTTIQLTANLGCQVDLMSLWHEAGLFHGEHTGLGRPCNIHTEPQSALIQTTAAQHYQNPPNIKPFLKIVS